MGRRGVILAGMIVFVLASASGQARAEDQAACTKAYESAQILKKNRKYLSARHEVLVCLRECPPLVQRECGQWFDAIESVVPSIVIHAEAGGEDRSDVRVEMDGKVLTERVDGKGIDVDPGQHEFTFTLAAFPPMKKNVVIHEGEQLRVVRVVFEKPDSGMKAAPIPATHRPVPAAVYVISGLGAAGVIGFTVFGLVGSAQRDRYERSCAPRCADTAVDAVHNNFLLADVSLGVGLAALATSTVVWLARPTVPALPESATITVAPARTGATFLGTLRF